METLLVNRTTATPGLINRYFLIASVLKTGKMGFNLEGKAELANSGPLCQLTLVTGWVKGKQGGQSNWCEV